jgi:DNA-binding MarR family transcriptional regulator
MSLALGSGMSPRWLREDEPDSAGWEKQQDRRLENLVGALAVAVGELVQERMAAAAGCSPTAVSALQWVGRGRGLRTRDVAEALGISMPGASQLIESLIGAGLIERSRYAHDQRQWRLRVTEPAPAARSKPCVHAPRPSGSSSRHFRSPGASGCSGSWSGFWPGWRPPNGRSSRSVGTATGAPAGTRSRRAPSPWPGPRARRRVGVLERFLGRDDELRACPSRAHGSLAGPGVALEISPLRGNRGSTP